MRVGCIIIPACILHTPKKFSRIILKLVCDFLLAELTPHFILLKTDCLVPAARSTEHLPHVIFLIFAMQKSQFHRIQSTAVIILCWVKSIEKYIGALKGVCVCVVCKCTSRHIYLNL